MLAAIEHALDMKVRPVLARHGGGVRVLDFTDDGVLLLQMLGQCSQCAGAAFENEQFFQNEIMQEIPDVKRVVLENRVDEELLDFARSLLNGHADCG